MTFSAHNVVSLFRAKPSVRDWDNSELAQFFRVEAALRQAGIFVDTQRGVTDEGDPWFVYCRQDNGDVFLHIARFDGFYVAASPTMSGPLVRKKFNELLDELVRDNPVILQPSSNRRPGPDLYIHPSTMLIAAVAALFYKTAPIRAEDHGDNPLRQSEARSAQGFGMLSDVYSVALVSAMAIIAVLHHTHAENVVVEENHQEQQALLDGILFSLGSNHNDLPAFEGNVEPTGLIGGVAQAATEVVLANQVQDNLSAATSDAAVSLQSLFGKFADTIIAASSAVTETAELAVAERHIASNDSQTVRSEALGGEGGDKVLPAHSPSSSAFVIAAAATPDFKNDQPQPVQQVSVAPSDQTAKEPAVVQVAALSAVPTATDVLTSSLQLDTSAGTKGGSLDPAVSQPATGGESTTVDSIVETPPEPVFYDFVQAAGMVVLLSSSHTAASTSPTATGVELPHQSIDVPLLGIVDDGHLLAVA